jgi:hypothetical protein
MENTVPLKIKMRDVAVGFFFWLSLHNFLLSVGFAILLFVDFPGFAGFDPFSLLLAIMWFTAIIVPLVFFSKKRIWNSIGIVVAIVINIGLWVVLFQDEFEPMVMILPLPLGRFVMQQ